MLSDVHPSVRQDLNTVIISWIQSVSLEFPWTACRTGMSITHSFTNPSIIRYSVPRNAMRAYFEQLLQECDTIRPFMNIIEPVKTFLHLLNIFLVFWIWGIAILACCVPRRDKLNAQSIYRIDRRSLILVPVRPLKFDGLNFILLPSTEPISCAIGDRTHGPSWSAASDPEKVRYDTYSQMNQQLSHHRRGYLIQFKRRSKWRQDGKWTCRIENNIWLGRSEHVAQCAEMTASSKSHVWEYSIFIHNAYLELWRSNRAFSTAQQLAGSYEDRLELPPVSDNVSWLGLSKRMLRHWLRFRSN